MKKTEMSKGKSVGAIVKDKHGRFLFQYRLKHPIGLAMPAGHMEGDESPEEALKREIPEETGLAVVRLKEVYHDLIPCEGICAKGHESHEWLVYEIETEGTPELKEPEKHKFLKFMSLEEIRPYIERGEYDPNWFKYILPELKII